MPSTSTNPLTSLFVARSARQQRSSALWSSKYWGAGSNDGGHLQFDGVDLAELVRREGSPVMVVSRNKLLSDARRFVAAVTSAFDTGNVAFSYKTNCIPGVIREIHDAGLAAEVISPYELWLAATLGVDGRNIIVNGVNKTDDYLDHAVSLGVASINIDEGGEVGRIASLASRQGLRARVGLRLRLDPGSHFGLDVATAEADEAAAAVAARSDALDFQGLHFHLLADNDDPENHARLAEKALLFAARIREKHGLATRQLNVGGGLTVPTVKVMSRIEYGLQRLLHVPCQPADPESHVDVESYMQRLAESISACCNENRIPVPAVTFEPGRAVSSQSHILLSEIHAIKTNPRGPATAMTDAGKILTSYPCDYEYHQVFVANKADAPPDHMYHLMGRLCTPADWLARYRCLPRLERGDVIAIMDAGAYFTSYASNFAFPRPAVVLLDSGQTRILRRGETFEHLTAMDDLAADA